MPPTNIFSVKGKEIDGINIIFIYVKQGYSEIMFEITKFHAVINIFGLKTTLSRENVWDR